MNKLEILARKQLKLDRKLILSNLVKEELKLMTGRELSEITWIHTSTISRISQNTESMWIDKVEEYIKLIKSL